jgi:AcrR family transcriptional regulator
MSVDQAPLPAAPRTGPRLGSVATRKAILDAARARFAQDGFTRSTIRSIASDAGVDASLVMQYFGSKADLFATVMDSGPNTMSRIADAFDGPENGLGERVTRAFLEVWDGDPRESEPLQALLRAAIGNEQATGQLRELIQKRVIVDLGPRLRSNSDLATRIEIASSMLVGVIVGRRLVGVDALVQQSRDSLVEIIAPAIQVILTRNQDAG